jgi:hypothetical protein
VYLSSHRTQTCEQPAGTSISRLFIFTAIPGRIEIPQESVLVTSLPPHLYNSAFFPFTRKTPFQLSISKRKSERGGRERER